ncbi:MAG: hypothetical protein AAGK23_13610 [Pseudomonadota bacterium]
MKKLLCAASLLALIGCSSVKISQGYKEDALTFYPPQPYLLVTDRFNSAGDTVIGQNIQVVYLPDCANARSIKAKAGIGSVTFNPTLTNGWNLTGFESMADNQIDETIGAIAELIPSFSLSEGEGGGRETSSSGLYQMLFSEGGLAGFARVTLPIRSKQMASTSGSGCFAYAMEAASKDKKKNN